MEATRSAVEATPSTMQSTNEHGSGSSHALPLASRLKACDERPGNWEPRSRNQSHGSHSRCGRSHSQRDGIHQRAWQRAKSRIVGQPTGNLCRAARHQKPLSRNRSPVSEPCGMEATHSGAGHRVHRIGLTLSDMMDIIAERTLPCLPPAALSVTPPVASNTLPTTSTTKDPEPYTVDKASKSLGSVLVVGQCGTN